MYSYSESATVKLVVGKEKRAFLVHHDLLTTSKFFKACLDSGFREGETGTITLEEDDPDAIETFVKWLYLEKVKPLTKEESNNFVARYAFAEKICDETYCNDLIDARRAYDLAENLFHTFVTVNKIYDSGLRSTPYAKCAIKSLVQQMLSNPANFAKKAKLPRIKEADTPDITEDIVGEIIEYQTKPYGFPYSFKGCHFHIHTDGSECSAGDS